MEQALRADLLQQSSASELRWLEQQLHSPADPGSSYARMVVRLSRADSRAQAPTGPGNRLRDGLAAAAVGFGMPRIRRHRSVGLGAHEAEGVDAGSAGSRARWASPPIGDGA